MSQQVHRREFLRLGGAAGLAAIASRAASAEETPRPIRLGVIGVGGRGTHLLGLALRAGVEVPALCDLREDRFERAAGLVERSRDGRRPAAYTGGPTDYLRLLERDDLDAVLVATPMQLHAPMSIDALRRGKHVLSEVSAAVTLDECWGLVRAARETDRIYMLSENCCYWRPVMMVLNMVRQGIFGELTFAECGYVHDCRGIDFDSEGRITWRGELARDRRGNLYPTHSLGPVAQWLGIHRGDRMVSLVAMDTRRAAMDHYLQGRFPEGHPARAVDFKVGDSTTVLIRTARGAVIDLRYDTRSARPHPSTTYYSLQGTRASYDSRIDSLWIEGRSPGYLWQALGDHAEEFEHPLWAKLGEAAEGSGHGGGDFMVLHAFLEAVRWGGPSPIDAADAAAWSAILPLSERSIEEGSRPQEIPDFTEGGWEKARTG